MLEKERILRSVLCYCQDPNFNCITLQNACPACPSTSKSKNNPNFPDPVGLPSKRMYGVQAISECSIRFLSGVNTDTHITSKTFICMNSS